MNLCKVMATISLTAALAFAQTDGITVSVSRSVELPVEDANFLISVQAESGVSLEKVVGALNGLNITAKDLVGINSQQLGPSSNPPRFLYLFSFTATFAKLKDTQEALAAAKTSLLAANMDLQNVSIQFAPSESAREAARQRLMPELLADARKRAEQIANAAGTSLGRILGIGEFVGATAAIIGGFPSSLRVNYQISARFRLDQH